MTAQSFANPFRPYNPFLSTEDTLSSEDLVVADAAEGGEVSYALVQNGPAVSSEETESHLDAIEVKVSWGTQILSTTHLEQGKGFSIGDGGDFVHPNAFAKTSLVSARGTVSIPEGATATVFAKGESPRSVKAGDEIELVGGMRLVIDLDPVTIEVSAVRAGKKFKVGFLASLAGGAAAAIGLSFVGHTAIVASLAFFMPSMANDDAESISREQVLKMQALLDASADREADKIKEEKAGEEAGGGSTGGEPHKGEMGKAGTDSPKMASGHMAFKGSDNKVQLSRTQELQLAREGGFVGMIRSGMVTNGPNSPWGADWQQGMDSQDAKGGLFGDNVGEEHGSGLGPSGTGIGGGGNGEGIGIDGVGNTVGGGGGGKGKWGYGPGDKGGIGVGHGPGGSRDHVAKAPTMRPEGITSVNGRLPPEVIQRIVRQNAGRMKMCFENGLRTNPTLSGRVSTKFIIGRDGAVTVAQDAGSDLPNQEVISCVVKAFQNLSFPAPEGGVATVIYPIAFTPGE